MFEVESLKYATLTTVSRSGMVWFWDDIVTDDMMYGHYLNRLVQNNYDDVMNYAATQVVDSLKNFFEKNGLAPKALEAVKQIPDVMEFTKIRVIESIFSLSRRGISNIL